MENRAQGVSLEVDLGLERLVGVDRSSTQEPCAQAVEVEVLGELGDQGAGIADDLSVDDLDAGDHRRGQVLVTLMRRGSKGGGAERKRRDDAVELHIVE